MEKRDARWEMKEPMLAPHALSAAFVSEAACVAAVAAVAAVIDRGFKCGFAFAFGPGLRAGDVVEFEFDRSEDGERKNDNCDEDLLRAPPPPPLSKSECVISTGVPEEVLDPASFPSEDELTDRWAHRSRTPSTAFKKLVEP